jgi:glutamyl/glutaminyl-tRNA synthetase
LEWLNGQYFLKRSPEYFLPLLKPLWEKAGLAVDSVPESYLLQCIGLLKDRSKRTTDFVEFGKFFFQDPESYDEKARKKYFVPGAESLLETLAEALEVLAEFSAAALEACYREIAERQGLKAADLIHPTRLAISGLPFGPGLFELMAVLDRERVVRRLRKAAEGVRYGFPEAG